VLCECLIAHWLQSLLITFKYSAIADLHTFQFTVAHALGFPVFTIRLLATDLNTETVTVSLRYTLQVLHINKNLQITLTVLCETRCRRAAKPAQPLGLGSRQLTFRVSTPSAPTLLKHVLYQSAAHSPLQREMNLSETPTPKSALRVTIYVYNGSLTLNYPISNCNRSELPVVYTLHERKLCCRSRRHEQSSVSNKKCFFRNQLVTNGLKCTHILIYPSILRTSSLAWATLLLLELKFALLM
jgi:hypothetical protein